MIIIDSLEKQIVRGLKNVNQESFTLLFDQYSKKRYGLALRMCGNREDAEDIVQKTYVQALTCYCSDSEPGLGYSIFNVESKEQLDKILGKLKPYSEVYEVAHIITLQEFQTKIANMD